MPGARLRHVDEPATDIDAVRQDQAGDGIARDDTTVTTIFRQAEDVAVGEPGQLGCELVAFARRCRFRHRETVLNDPRDVPFQPAQVIHIGDNAFAGLAPATGAINAMPPGDIFTTWQGNSRRSGSR
jgi:hypothetical protein